MIAVAAAALAIPFAPPLDHPLRYRTVETRHRADGRATHFTLVQEARFTRDGGGYLLTLATISFDTDGTADEQAKLAASMRPTVPVPLRIRVDGEGVATGVLDGAANWSAAVAGMRDAAGGDSARLAAIAALAALPPAGRDAQLLVAADDVLPAPGQRIAHRHAERSSPQPGGATLAIAEDIDVSADSGLVTARRRTMRAAPAGGGPAVPVGETEVLLVGY